LELAPKEMIAENPFSGLGRLRAPLEKIKNRLRDRAEPGFLQGIPPLVLLSDETGFGPRTPGPGTAVLAASKSLPWWPPITGAAIDEKRRPQPTTSGAAIYFYFRVSFWVDNPVLRVIRSKAALPGP